MPIIDERGKVPQSDGDGDLLDELRAHTSRKHSSNWEVLIIIGAVIAIIIGIIGILVG